MTRSTILIIGAGVAGSACAIRLRQLGIEVQLVERATFPRNKVCGCCLGGAGLDALERLQLRDWVCDTGVTTTSWLSSMGDDLITLELPAGIAISRESLDCRLLQSAEDAGATVISPCQARIESADERQVSVRLENEGSASNQLFGAAVIAAGLNAGSVTKLLPWKQRPHGPFGVSFTAQSEVMVDGTIYMACDHDGYVGLVKLENGRVDIAAALHSGATSRSLGDPKQRINGILSRSRFPDLELSDASPILTTGRLRRSRTAGNGRVLAIGDSAGYVEPFTGEGMTWAMRSGIVAAELLAESMDDLTAAGSRWDRERKRLLAHHQVTCAAVTGALRKPWARRTAAKTLRRWPWLAEPLIRRLNRS